MNRGIASVINNLVSCYFLSIDDAGEAKEDLARIVGQFRSLPVLMEPGGCYLLTPDLKVVGVSWGGEAWETLERGRFYNTVLHHASLKYDELAELRPEPDNKSVTCPTCDGQGVPPAIPREIADIFLCECGGLGWIPRDDRVPDKYLAELRH